MYVTGTFTVLVLPDTRKRSEIITTQTSASDRPPRADNIRLCFTQNLKKGLQDLTEGWHFVQADTRLVALMISLVFIILGRFVQEIMLQYTTKSYSRSWSKVSEY